MLLLSVLPFVSTFIMINCDLVNPDKSITDYFRECLLSQYSGKLGQCLGIGAMSRLQSWDNNSEFDLIDGVTLTRDDQEYREVHNFADKDPSNFRSIMDTFNYIISKRSMRWDMGFLYPGLAMRVAPSLNPGGVLEFILDPHQESVNIHSLKESGTGRLLARQFLVPFLLGFKFNIATILPILFGILAILAKKAVVISKLALILSSAFGLGTLLFGNTNKVQQYHTSPYNPGFSSSGYNRFPEEHYQDDSFYRSNNVYTNDQLRLYGNIPDTYDRIERGNINKGRNFAWSEDEKAKKNIKEQDP